ncbi:MAG: TIR domain-containing protein [Gammaproteobacteria bacterium]|nr:TIR domain-containing protein [Gammaproteobacteria bacterium]
MQATGRSKVFISYSRVDLAFTNELADALEASGDFDILIDRVGIGHGEAWRERLRRLIVECDTLVFVLSPDSVASDVCAWEIGEARRLSKRIIPVLWRAVDFSRVPDDLGAINAVPFDGEHAVSGLPKLVSALNSDLAWLREHTRLGERADEWELSGRAPAYLLRGAALVAARAWLDAKPGNAPAATALQRQYIEASDEEQGRLQSDERQRAEELAQAKAIAEAERDAAERARASEARSARRVVRATAAGLVVALALLVVASAAGWFAWQKANDERAAARLAADAADRATAEAARAAAAAARADAERDAALLTRSRFLARAAQTALARGDAANAIALARSALPTNLAEPDVPFSVDAVQAVFDAYGKLHERATLRGHSGRVKGALGIGGDRIVTWARDGTIRWWRNDGSPLRTVVAHRHPTKTGTSEDTGVHGVLRLRDGRLLSWGVDKTVKLWNDNATAAGQFIDATAWIRVQRLHDGRIAALIGNELHVWGADLEPSLVLRSPLQWMRGATLLRDGRILTWQSESASKTHTAMLWHADGSAGRELAGHRRMISDAFELADGRIVTLDNIPSLRVWSADGELEAHVEKAHLHTPLARFAFPLRDGRFFSWGQEAYHDNIWWGRLWNAQGDAEPLIEASDAPLHGFELDDGRLLLGIKSQAPTIWRVDGSRGPILRGHDGIANGAMQLPGGAIVTYGADGSVRLWSRNGSPLRLFSGHEGGVSGIVPLAAERYLSWSFDDRTVRLWDEAPQPRSVLTLEGGAARGVHALADGAIAVHTNDGSIALYGPDLVAGAVLRNDGRDLAGLVVLPDGRLLTRGENYANREPGPALRLWSATGEFVADLAGPDVELADVAVRPSGGILGFDGSGQVWRWRADGQLEDRQPATAADRIFRVFPLHTGGFVTVGDANRLRLWSADGAPGRVLGGSATVMPKQVVAFANGNLLIVGQDGEPTIWDRTGERRTPLARDDDTRTNSATALADGTVLVEQYGGRLLVVGPDRQVREMPVGNGSDGAYPRHTIVALADGRLLLSTSNQGTRLWDGADGPGRLILDRTLTGAVSLADGSFVVWPGNDRHTLQFVSTDGAPGPALRGHTSTIAGALQLPDGRIVSWADDASVRIWPGSVEQAVTWADDVIARLDPLTHAERCDHYLEPPTACAGPTDR